MTCRTHPERGATNMCSNCSSPLCADCAVEIRGKQFCRPCIAVAAQDPAYTSYDEPPMAGHPPRKISCGMLFLCSFLPGANYMYMGLMKRGLAAMCGFFLIIFMLSNVGGPLAVMLSLAIPVYVVSILFDGFNVRRRIIAGEAVRDEIGDALNGIIANRMLRNVVIAVLAITLAVTVLGWLSSIIARLLPLLIVGIGVYVLVKRKPPER